MSGVAQLSSESRHEDDKYIAGHWVSDFPRGLLWGVHPGIDTKGWALSGKAYAPSWSWGAVTCPVQYFSYIDGPLATPFCTLLRAHPGDPISVNRFGPTNGAYLEIGGPVYKIKDTVWARGHLGEETNELPVRDRRNPQLDWHWKASLRRDAPPPQVSGHHVSGTVWAEEILYFLPMALGSEYQLGDLIFQEMAGLAVEEVDSPCGTRSFARRGLLQVGLKLLANGRIRSHISWEAELGKFFRAWRGTMRLV